MSEQEFEAYLRLMGRFLRLSDDQRGTIGRELRGHMEERLEDLIARGFTREDAVNTILDEFGDAAVLAGEFGRIGMRRKWIMRTTAGTIGIAAAVLLVSFLLPENRPLPSPSYSHAEQVSNAGAGAPQRVAATPRATESVRTGLLVGAQSESAADRRTREKLAQTIQAEFPEGTSFDEVLSFLRDQGDLSIAVNWNALNVSGIDRATDTLGMSVKDAKLETVLDMLLENIGGQDAAIGYAIVDGIVRISTSQQLDRNTTVRVYDVEDLIHRDLAVAVDSMMKNQPATPQSPMGPGMAGGGGGFGMPPGGPMSEGMESGHGVASAAPGDLSQTQAIIRAVEASRVEALEQLIRTTIQRGTWSPEGALASMSYYEGLLVVDHTARAHQELADLLAVIRRSLAARPKSMPTAAAPVEEGGSMEGAGSMGGYAVEPRDTLANVAREHYASAAPARPTQAEGDAVLPPPQLEEPRRRDFAPRPSTQPAGTQKR